MKAFIDKQEKPKQEVLSKMNTIIKKFKKFNIQLVQSESNLENGIYFIY